MDVNDNRRKVSRNEIGNGSKSESQVGLMPPVEEEPLDDTASNAGILFYKYFSREMENEINELENNIENIKSTIKTQKQNILEMETQKQNMISDFHEQYRKFNQKSEYQNKLEDELGNIVQFLENLIILKTDILNMRMEEIKIRNYVISNFKQNYEELKGIENSYETENQKLRERVNHIEDMKNQWLILHKLDDKMSDMIRICSEKINRLQWSIKNEKVICEQTKNESDILQTQISMEIKENRQLLRNKVLQTQQNFYHLRNQFLKLKEFKEGEIDLKVTIENLQKELSKKINQINEIENDITIKFSVIQELQEKNENCMLQMKNIDDDVNNFNHENETLNDIIQHWKTQINDEQIKQNNALKAKQSMEEEVKHALTEIEKLNTERKVLEMEKSLYSNIEQRETLKKKIIDLKKDKSIAKDQIMNLKTTLEEKERRINKLKKQLLSSNTSNQSLNSNKQNFLDSYLKIETQQNVIFESVESELDDLFDEICDLQPFAQQSEEIWKHCSEKGAELDEAIHSNEKILQKTIEDIKICENSIYTLKQNVYQGKCITQQDLNKKLNILINGIKTEQTAVEKLKKEVEQETRQKRPLFSTESKRKPTSLRAISSKSKKCASQEIEENSVSSPDSDIYTFK